MHCMTHNEFNPGTGRCGGPPRCNGPVARWFGRRWKKRQQQQRQRLAAELELNTSQAEQFNALLDAWGSVRARRFSRMSALRQPLSELLAEPAGSRSSAREQLRTSIQAVEAELVGLLDEFADFSEQLDPAQRAKLLSQLEGSRR